MQLLMLSVWDNYVKDWKAHTVEEHMMQIISVVLILLIGLIAVKLIGKKSIARLNLMDVLFIFVLSSTLGALITKPVRIFVALLVVAVIVIFVFIFQKLQLKINFFEKLLQGKAEIIYQDKKFNEKALKKNNLTIDTIEAVIRQNGFPSVDVIKTIVLETTGTLSFQSLPEYEPIKKIYFDAAMEQIMQAINDSKYIEAKLPEINDAFKEVDKNQPSSKKDVPKKLQ